MPISRCMAGECTSTGSVQLAGHSLVLTAIESPGQNLSRLIMAEIAHLKGHELPTLHFFRVQSEWAFIVTTEEPAPQPTDIVAVEEVKLPL